MDVQFFSLVGWLCLNSLVYGFHISALNSPQDVIICPPKLVTSPLSSGFSSCLRISEADFGLITSAFTLGGLIGCLFAPAFLARRSQKASLVLCALLSGIGAVIQATAPGMAAMVIGRAVTGFGAAISISVVPTALSVVAPPSIKGSIGVLHQLSIVLGILCAQALGLKLSQPSIWRYIPVFSFAVSVFQILSAPLIPSPDAPPKAKSTLSGEEEGLLAPPVESAATGVDDLEPPRGHQHVAETDSGAQMGVGALLRSAPLRRGVCVTLGAMLLQQFSGINAVMFFSTAILTPILPANARLISFQVTVFNVFMTLPAIVLIERLGRRSLLLISGLGMLVSASLLGYGLNHELNILSAAMVFVFVGSFAIGLGPVPFILTGELVPPPARASLSSLSLVVNFVANLVIGSLFLPLRTYLSTPAPTPTEPKRRVDEGTVFYIFSVALALGVAGLWRGYRSS